MGKQVEELVEWVAKTITDFDCSFTGNNECADCDISKEKYFNCVSKAILFNPDFPLALIDEGEEESGWQYYLWDSSRKDEIMSRYQSGKIDKVEKHRLSHIVHAEEVAIYEKGKNDMKLLGFKKVIPLADMEVKGI